MTAPSAPLEAPGARSHKPIAAVAALCAILALATAGTAHPVVLINTTPSEPVGLYLATSAPLTPGRLIAFRAPAAAFPYADARLSYLRRVPLLKAVAAVAGDDVCSTGMRLSVNGRDQGRIVERDARGVALPHWRGCRRLTPGEVFVLSARAPNSFDSRYFGPVPMSAVIGVYRAFLTTAVRL